VTRHSSEKEEILLSSLLFFPIFLGTWRSQRSLRSASKPLRYSLGHDFPFSISLCTLSLCSFVLGKRKEGRKDFRDLIAKSDSGN
jgi:hypothetical protein